MGLDTTIGSGETIDPKRKSSLGRIDQYELVRELGGGGFGTVFLAKDSVAGVDVAVKGLPPLVKNNKEELENIRKNFQLVSRLHDKHIAAALVLHPVRTARYEHRAIAEKLRVFEGDTLMVLEFAPGVTLSQWRKQFPDGRVPPEKVIEIVRQIADALDYAHGEKIIHRDIKPANVMIETRPDGALIARVLDFGLAAEVRSSMGRVSQQVTDTSGTRPYMAPEQWLGKKQNATTDQYALAVLAYELLTGEVPFASVFETGDPVVMMNVVGHEQPEISEELPRAMRRAFEIALAKDSAQRFENCAAFVAALSGRRASSGGKARTLNTLRWIAIAIAAVLTVASVGGYTMWRHHKAEAAQREEADRQRELARQTELNRQAKAMAEAQRLAAEKAEAEAKAKAEEEIRVAEEKRQREAEHAAEALVFTLSSKAEGAHDLINAETSDFKSFFAAEIRAFENERRAGDDAKKNAKYIIATNLLTKSLAKATALGEAKTQRQQCQDALAAAERARSAAQAVGADSEAESAFEAASADLTAASDALREKRFSVALDKAQTTERRFGEIRSGIVSGILALAKSHKAAERWQECLNASEKIIGWEPNNEEAKALKDEASRHLVPTVRVVAKIGDREVPASIEIEGKRYTLPATWSKGVKRGEQIPCAGLSISYVETGQRYGGRIPRTTVDWKGERTIVVALQKFEYDYIVSTSNELKETLEKCQSGATIFLKSGTYESVPRIKKSITLVGESRESVKLTKQLGFRAEEESTGGNYACQIKSLSVVVDSGSALDVTLGGGRALTLEIDDCDLLSKSHNGVFLEKGLERLVMHRCRVKGNTTHGASYMGAKSMLCSDCEFENNRQEAVQLVYGPGRSIWNGCRFTAGSDATASFDNSYGHTALFNSCEFHGGKVGIRFGKAKCYNCKFSGKVSDSDNAQIVNHKLTDADF